MRIVTLLPSATEIACALDLREHLVGVSHECDYPAGVAALPHVTRTRIDHHATSADIDGQVRRELSENNALYSLETGLLAELRPDIIVTQSLCDVCAVADDEVRAFVRGRDPAPEIVNIQPFSLSDVMDTVTAIGTAAGVAPRAAAIVDGMRRRFDAVRERSQRDIPADQRIRVAFLEWIDPLFCGGHWNPELVALAGGTDCLGRAGQASAMVGFEALAAADPDAIFIACCGFDLERSLAEIAPILAKPSWRSLRAVRNKNVHVTDGNAYFSRPGPRLADSAEIIAHALYPDVHEPGPASAVRL